ncbi:unnamed protein product [Penicillium pancosmium]
MEEPATAPWGLSISDADFEKLKAGFNPRDMDDKWHVFVTDQSESSNISIHFARSWTGKVFYILVVNPGDSVSTGGVKIEALTWEQSKGRFRISEEQAKKEAIIMSRYMWNYPAAQPDAS